MKNIENIKLVLKKIEENPECWQQKTWHCGTSHCFAGHGQVEAGKPILDSTARVDARIFFGFTKDEADYYFQGQRTLKELKTSIEDFYDGDGFDRDGFDREGFDVDGLDRNNNLKPE